ncbi:unnamed protein product [Parajaminaea phylloscopi]
MPVPRQHQPPTGSNWPGSRVSTTWPVLQQQRPGDAAISTRKCCHSPSVSCASVEQRMGDAPHPPSEGCESASISRAAVQQRLGLGPHPSLDGHHHRVGRGLRTFAVPDCFRGGWACVIPHRGRAGGQHHRTGSADAHLVPLPIPGPGKRSRHLGAGLVSRVGGRRQIPKPRPPSHESSIGTQGARIAQREEALDATATQEFEALLASPEALRDAIMSLDELILIHYYHATTIDKILEAAWREYSGLGRPQWLALNMQREMSFRKGRVPRPESWVTTDRTLRAGCELALVISKVAEGRNPGASQMHFQHKCSQCLILTRGHEYTNRIIAATPGAWDRRATGERFFPAKLTLRRAIGVIHREAIQWPATCTEEFRAYVDEWIFEIELAGGPQLL